MKKLVMSLVLGASLAIVPSAFALKAMTADNMKDTTGQAGVDIAVDNIIIYSGASTTIYRDNDGLVDPLGNEIGGTAGLVIAGIGGFTFIDGIVNGQGAANDYVALMNSAAGEGNTFHARALTIDVTDKLVALSAGYTYNYALAGGTTDLDIAGVQIGLPTVEIRKSGSEKTYSVDAATSYNGTKQYIQVEKTSSTMAILGGTIEIAPH